MNAPRGSVLLITGPAASGKTTVADLIESRYERSVHVEADRFFGFVVGGYVDPWDPSSHEQNALVMEIACNAAGRYAEAGYRTVLEGMLIPGWFYEPVRDRLRAQALDVAVAIVRPSLATTLERGRARVPPKRLPDEVLEQLWSAFTDLGPLETHVFENDASAPEATAEAIVAELHEGTLAV